MTTFKCEYCGADNVGPNHHNAHGLCPGGLMDPAAWDEFRTAVLEQVTGELDRMRWTVASMEPTTATFEGTFTVGGLGRFTTGTWVKDMPLWFEDEPDGE